MVDRARAGELGNMLWLIVGVVVVVIGLVIAFLVYGPMSRTVANMGTVTISGNLIGTQGANIQLTASGGTVTITSVTIYDPSGNKLLALPGTLPTGCSLTIYNSSGSFTSWGRQVINPGSAVTIQLTGTCGLGSAYEVIATSPSGKSFTGYING
ncbi:hypothetical protein JCM16161A_02300 [Vulcanisaeta sp. JCM 16161]|uniref:hypothetical protein n=1 Tax=Vulcanisaeta sp. JCM 16161 TaxID=1295372 RepID=UPI0006D0E410|nr:hypothetical protein [Vulcanisaeta sp. JCM 16161]